MSALICDKQTQSDFMIIHEDEYFKNWWVLTAKLSWWLSILCLERSSGRHQTKCSVTFMMYPLKPWIFFCKWQWVKIFLYWERRYKSWPYNWQDCKFCYTYKSHYTQWYEFVWRQTQVRWKYLELERCCRPAQRPSSYTVMTTKQATHIAGCVYLSTDTRRTDSMWTGLKGTDSLPCDTGPASDARFAGAAPSVDWGSLHAAIEWRPAQPRARTESSPLLLAFQPAPSHTPLQLLPTPANKHLVLKRILLYWERIFYKKEILYINWLNNSPSGTPAGFYLSRLKRLRPIVDTENVILP